MKTMPRFGKLVCISLWFIIASTNAEPSMCYYCTTDADGTACDSPMNSNNIRAQFCENSTVTTDIAAVQQLANSENTAEGIYVCTVITYVSNLNNFVTIRECQSRLVEGVGICDYLTAASITPQYSRNFSCRTCNSDLCNNKATVHISTVAFIGIALVKLFI